MKPPAPKSTFLSVVAKTLLVVTFLCGFGCDRQTEVPAAKPDRKQATAPKHSAPADLQLQRAVDRLRSQDVETDPKKRPLVISERADSRREWTLKALLKGYEQSGHNDTRWDAIVRSAFEAYSDFSRGGRGERYADMMTQLTNIVAEGCADPMYRYMRVRYGSYNGENGRKQYALAMLEVHDQMLQSKYHPTFQFLAGYRACAGARDADKDGTRGVRLQATGLSLQDLVRDTNAPVEEVFENVFNWTEYTHNHTWFEMALTNLMPYVEINWGKHEQYCRWRGMVETDIAWAKRGGGYANTVTEEGWKGFAEHLQLAETLLKKAWQLNDQVPQTAYLMMRVELGQGQGLARMQTWFQRAMNLNTNYFDAASLMSYYLEPRWHGDENQCLQFARSCVASKKWAGQVPLVLASTHNSLAHYHKQDEDPAYWHRPSVWKDLKASYDRFFELNPNEFGWRHDYAKAAYLCGQYDAFLQQAKLFPWTNFPWWGGQKKFGLMVATAVSEQGKNP